MLSLLRRSARLDERPLEVGESPEPPPCLDRADGYVVWSQPLARRLPVYAAQRDAILYAPRQYRRFTVDLSGSFEQYMSAFSGKTRSTLKRKLRKFAEASGGAIDWKECRTPEEIEEFFPLARKVSAITYQERRFRSGLPNTEAFVAAARESSKMDKVRAYLLCFNKDPISYLYCPIAQGVVLYNYLGYDPAYAALSPGTVLQFLALQALFAERRFVMFDFTEGEGQHKKAFSTQNVLCGDVFVLNRRLAPLAVVTLHRSVAGISTTAGAALDRLRLKSRVRRLLRQN